MPRELINVAYGKPCIQSSGSKWSKQYGANGVTQELKYEESFGFHTNGLEKKPFLIVDLLWVYSLDSIVIYNRKEESFIHHSKSIRIEVSIDNNNWILLHKGRVWFSYNEPFKIPLLSQIDARYIKLNLEEEVYFHLYKIDVFAEDAKVYISESLIDKSPYTNLNTKNKLKTVVLGTSNSLLQGGYSYNLSNLNLIKNISLGSSHATMIPYRLNLIKSLEVDVIILDIAVNEQRAYNSNLYNLTIAEEIFKMFLVECAKKKIVPIVLIMPNLKCINSEIEIKKDSFSFEIRNYYKRICLKHSVAYFDGFSFIQQLSKKFKRTQKSFFNDPLHLRKFPAKILGFSLSSSINKFYRLLNSAKKLKRNSYKFIFLDIKPYVSIDKIVQRKTSLVSVSLARLELNNTINMLIPSGTLIVGFILNMYKTNASLKIKTKNKTFIKRLDSDQYKADGNLALVSWSMIKPFEVFDNSVTLEVISSLDSINLTGVELNDHCKNFITNTDIPVIEIEGLILQSIEKEEVYTNKSMYYNLTNVMLPKLKK